MDPALLDVLGVQVEIRAWRGTDNLFEATLTDADGNGVDLTDSSVTMVIVDRAGGTEKFSQVNAPGDHTTPGDGVTRFNVGAATFDGVTGQRAYTWKYQIWRTQLATGRTNVYFYGDFRVMPTSSPI